ncbi:uncharacterized protein [Nicotiana tomentosiformis]|uniref:uncharacterized protein n=1 Tax=Nicotiana tomentosiformis TaxID=4098 RepID=UPI00388CE5F7
MGTSYELVVDIARRIEGARQRAREQAMRDTRFWYSGEFSRAPAGGMGEFVRGQSSKPTYPAPPPPRGAPVRPYFSAVPESSYRLPALQGSSSGYSGHRGQAFGHQSAVLRGCYECGDPSHMKRFYPRLQGKAVQRGHQSIITVPAAPSAVRPPRGGGQVGRGRPRGGGQTGEGQSSGAPARFYAFPARPDAVASDAVITCIISVCGRETSVLFDPGYTYLYVSYLFAHFLGVSRESLGTPVYVSTPVGNFVVVDRIYQSCIVNFYGYKTRADLLLLDMIEFEVILGMDWLSPYHAILHCHAKTVTLGMPEVPKLEWKGSSVSTPSRVISFLKDRHMVEKGCLAYLAYIRDTTIETSAIDSVPMVREFSDMFPSDLPGMPLDRDIDFCIDLAPGTQPISIPPYCMALRKMKEQLEELLAKGVFRPYIDSFLIVFIDDILIYSRSMEEHEQHLRVVLQTLREQKLYAKFSKYELGLDSVAFLRHVISGEGMKVDPKKIEAVQSWPRPTTTTEIRSFIGLTGYYHLFVEGFSSIAAPLTRLTQKGALFLWSDDCEASFQKLKTALTSALVLVFPSSSGMYTVYCNASRVDLGYVLMHEGVFYEVYTNHRSLQHLFKQRDLNLRQCMWLKLLKDYDITILYHPSKGNVVADALSRKAESIGSLAFISVEERPLALDIQSLANRIVRLDILEPSQILACVVAQLDDLHLLVLRETVLQGGLGGLLSVRMVSLGRLAYVLLVMVLLVERTIFDKMSGFLAFVAAIIAFCSARAALFLNTSISMDHFLKPPCQIGNVSIITT